MASADDAIANEKAAEARRAEEAAGTIVSVDQLKLLDSSLASAVLDLRAVSWGLRSQFLFDDYEFLRAYPSAAKYMDDIIYEACTFKEGLLLIAVNILKHIKKFFTNYIDYGLGPWIERMNTVANECEENGRLCELLATWYSRFADALEKRVPLAESLKTQFLIMESKDLKKNMKILKMRWTVLDHLMCPLMFANAVGSLAAEFAVVGEGKAASNHSKEIAAKLPIEHCAVATMVLTDSLIPVTRRFARHVLDVSEVLLAMAPRLRQEKPDPRPETPPEYGEGLDGIRQRLKAGDYGAKAKAKAAERAKKKAEEQLTPEQQFQNAMLKFHHIAVGRQKAHRAANWCDDLVALDPLFDYDLEFVPAYKLKDRDYVNQWIDAQKTDAGEGLADLVRDATLNSEILSALPR